MKETRVRSVKRNRAGGPERARRHKSHDERRAEILAATLSIIADEGLNGWTTSALARRVGVSEATLFRHFSSKEEIQAAAVRHQAETLRRRIAGYAGNGGPWEQLLGLVIEVLSSLEDAGSSPLLILSGQAAILSEESRLEVEATRKLLHWRLTELFRQAGCVDDDSSAPPQLLAEMTIAVIQSTGLRWLMSGRDFPMECEAGAMLRVLRSCVASARPEAVGVSSKL